MTGVNKYFSPGIGQYFYAQMNKVINTVFVNFCLD